jgi:hypothetical protein
MQETYDILVNCTNCSTQNSVQIPKGTTVHDFLAAGADCSNCGCDISS